MSNDHFGKFKNARTAWVVTDGTKGMEVQSIGLAERMGLKITIITMKPPMLTRHFPRSARWPFMVLPKQIRQELIRSGWPDLVITTGRRMAGLSILLREKSNGSSQTIHIQDPKLPPSFFDLLIVPSHDRLRGDNVLVSLGSLNSLTMDKIKSAAADLPEEFAQMPRPLIAVMIGGSNRRYGVNEPQMLRLGQVAAGVGHAVSGSLIFIPSRRSHEMAAECIRATIGKDLLEPPAHWIWDGKSPNPYPSILGVVDAIIVTSDSVNMTSEACLSGKPVYRYDFVEEQGRIGLFHRIMEEAGLTQNLEPIDPSVFPRHPDHAPYQLKHDETGRIAQFLLGQ